MSEHKIKCLSGKKLTVVNLPIGDGIGSLLEYILGALFFCRMKGWTYVHSRLHGIRHNKDMAKRAWLDDWHTYIKTVFLPGVEDIEECDAQPKDMKDIKDIKDIKDMRDKDLSDYKLFRLTSLSYLKIVFDWAQDKDKGFTKQIIDNYKSKTIPTDFSPKTINIAVHIRRHMEGPNADLTLAKAKWREVYEVGNDADIYFQNIITDLAKLLPEAAIHVYSQGDEKLYSHYKDLTPNLRLHLTNTAKHDLLHLVHADILVMSKGSYSRIANFYSSGVKLVRESHRSALTEHSLFVPSSGHLSDLHKTFIKAAVIKGGGTPKGT